MALSVTEKAIVSIVYDIKSSLSIVPLSYRVSCTGTKTFNSNLPSASVFVISNSLISVTVSDNLALATNLITSVLS